MSNSSESKSGWVKNSEDRIKKVRRACSVMLRTVGDVGMTDEDGKKRGLCGLLWAGVDCCGPLWACVGCRGCSVVSYISNKELIKKIKTYQGPNDVSHHLGPSLLASCALIGLR